MVQYNQLWFTCDDLRTAVWTSCRHWFRSKQTTKIKCEDANDDEDGHKRLVVVKSDDLTWQLELALALEQEEVDLRNLGSIHLLSYEGLITNAHDLEHNSAKKTKNMEKKSPCIKRKSSPT